MKKALLVLTSCFLASLTANYACAYPSGDVWPPLFENRLGEWYDKPWGLSRNVWYGENGYFPGLAYESLGNFADLAYSWGEEFRVNYPDRLERAKAVLSFVQRSTDYGCDEDNVFMEEEPQVEWAWNADEMAYMIEEARIHGTIAIGDCEDFAFLCTILYLAAGFDVAIVEAPKHLALLIWLPEYPNANIYWDILDGRGYGWIWVEATGDRNQLGWTPPDFSDGYFDTYVIESYFHSTIRINNINYSPLNPTSQDEVHVTAQVESNELKIVDVKLIYSVNNVKNIIPMNFVGYELYEATVPRQEGGTAVEFYIRARDEMGSQVESTVVTYKVSDDPVLPDDFYLWIVCAVGYALVLVLVVLLKRKS